MHGWSLFKILYLFIVHTYLKHTYLLGLGQRGTWKIILSTVDWWFANVRCRLLFVNQSTWVHRDGRLACGGEPKSPCVHAMGRSSVPFRCMIMPANARSDASVSISTGVSGSYGARTFGLMNSCFSLWKSLSSSLVHFHSDVGFARSESRVVFSEYRGMKCR